MIVRVGTRGSKLANIQADLAIAKLATLGINCKKIIINTTGDKITDKALYDIGGKALFLKELEEALIAEEIDIAVHSMKDVPAFVPPELTIAAVFEREDPRDILVCKKADSIMALPKGAIVGTSSMRRQVFIKKLRPDLECVTFRGNVQTRLKKLEAGEVDATILAAAGINRLQIWDESFNYISTEDMIPAVGQGTIAIEARKNDHQILELLAQINDEQNWYISQLERGFLEKIDGSCRTPLSGYARSEGGRIRGDFMLCDDDGNNMRCHQEFFNIKADLHQEGQKVAAKML